MKNTNNKITVCFIAFYLGFFGGITKLNMAGIVTFLFAVINPAHCYVFSVKVFKLRGKSFGT
jgi:hypothetical protein